MAFRMPDDPEGLALIRRYVIWSLDPPPRGRRYMRLLGTNALRSDDLGPGAFTTVLADDARRIDDAELGTLLEFEWRARLTAAWLIGLDRRTQFRETLRDLLLDSELTYAGQGYCFALTRFAQPDDADILTTYLDRYLPRTDCHYDQDWAIGALLHLDQKLGTDHAQRFLTPEGLWSQSAFAERDPLACQRTTEQLCAFADRLMGTNP